MSEFWVYENWTLHKAVFHHGECGACKRGRGQHGGGEVASWQTDDFWRYAMYAAIAYIRAAASREASQCARHARTWTSASATRHHNAE
jgi:hypothetical protein